uniref:Amino acid transporter transmembrane domain-containing protein n=1 Tax=Mycena chlorophos TaxID=658473 RepID=A0ABQ0KXH1_MYCCL|nr:predicted protein [Mycena chlorophos]
MADITPPSEKIDEKRSEEGVSSGVDSLKSNTDIGPVWFETYLYYAALQRHEEDPKPPKGISKLFYDLSSHKGSNVNIDIGPHIERERAIPLEEREAAARALRLASWSSVFFLITTDILGPFNAPYAISQTGWVPGIILYFFMGAIAAYTGLILWRLYIRLDSNRYPIRSYGDIMHRIYGTTARRIANVMQSIQLIIVVGIICLANGQSVSQIAKGHICFSLAIIIWAIFGCVIGQIRTLRNYGWLANVAVWINLLIIFTAMGFVSHSPPNFSAAQSSLGVSPGPVVTEKFAKVPLFDQVNGIMNMLVKILPFLSFVHPQFRVYAYGGAMIFPEMLAEMRRPMDFWKGMVMAQMLIFSAYLLFGAFVYSQQGQFSLPLAYQGVSKYAWQTIGNALSLITGIIAAGLYGNIGIKVVYHNIIVDWFHGPPLMSMKGRIIWSFLVLIYWSLAFVLGSAIPQVNTINGLVGAAGIMQFTYTFPPMLRFGYDVITDAMAGDGTYDPLTNQPYRVDTWRDWSRWKRGLFSGRWYFKLLNFGMTLAAIAMAALGLWAAGEAAKQTFAFQGAATSFGCTAPV